MGRRSLIYMFGITITSIQDAVVRLKNVKDGQEFSVLLTGLRNFLKTLDTTPQCLMELEQRAYYPINEYSDKETRNNLDAATKRVIEYLEEIMTGSPADDQLLTVLDNYYLFLDIYFFIYDKEKIIENPQLFRNTYENKVKGKRIHIVIHQPKIL